MSITALDAVDRGRVRLNDRVTLDRGDLTLFHQPIAAKILGGGYTTTLEDLMFKAITTSDNTANDKLMRSIGGAEAVRRMISTKGLGAIRFYNGERALQSKIAGLIWSPELLDRQRLLRSKKRTSEGRPSGRLRSLCGGPV